MAAISGRSTPIGALVQRAGHYGHPCSTLQLGLQCSLFLLCSHLWQQSKGSRYPDRIPSLRFLCRTAHGFVRTAICLNCRHMAPLPIRNLVRRFGELYPIDEALMTLRCEECGQSKVEARLIPLCEPGCRHCR